MALLENGEKKIVKNNTQKKKPFIDRHSAVSVVYICFPSELYKILVNKPKSDGFVFNKV